MKQDPTEHIWNPEFSSHYESNNYGSGAAGFVMRASHMLVEKPFDPSTHFSRVLEVGAGSGLHLSFVRHSFDEYWMTDASTAMLEETRKRYPASERVHTEMQDATQLSYPDQSFDRLIAAHVLEHLYKPHEVLREWVRVLKPGGMLSLVLPCDPGLLWRLGRCFGPRKKAEAVGIPYDYVMAREHVNPITNLVTFLHYYFDHLEESWWPMRIPLSDANLIYTANIRV